MPERLIEIAQREGSLTALRVSGSGWTREVHVMSRAGALQPAGRRFVSLPRRLCGNVDG